ncbi:hypothetical protein, partial [Sinorhizobium medicae]|uniref:hypothetical protein n=1 Tax=Sinorhizobium medicae TaxID=110321 RepID=UPI001AED1C71
MRPKILDIRCLETAAQLGCEAKGACYARRMAARRLKVDKAPAGVSGGASLRPYSPLRRLGRDKMRLKGDVTLFDQRPKSRLSV